MWRRLLSRSGAAPRTIAPARPANIDPALSQPAPPQPTLPQPALPPGETVAEYYDASTDVYLRATGDFIQAFRSTDTDALMAYLANSIGLVDGMRVLDAGCGIGAPALWLARNFRTTRIDGVTNSPRQHEIAQQRIASAEMAGRVTVSLGDFHDLGANLPKASYDRVIFLESLGHHRDLQRVVDSAATMLRPGGALYIKDFFRRMSADPAVQSGIDTAISTINRNYVYNVMDLSELITRLRSSGFTLGYARQPDLVPDLQLTVAFEHEMGRLTYPSFANVHAVDWFELLAVRDA